MHRGLVTGRLLVRGGMKVGIFIPFDREVLLQPGVWELVEQQGELVLSRVGDSCRAAAPESALLHDLIRDLGCILTPAELDCLLSEAVSTVLPGLPGDVGSV